MTFAIADQHRPLAAVFHLFGERIVGRAQKPRPNDASLAAVDALLAEESILDDARQTLLGELLESGHAIEDRDRELASAALHAHNVEELLGELENRVRRLEQGELPLAEALVLFEEGIELSRDCHERLDARQHRILTLHRDPES